MNLFYSFLIGLIWITANGQQRLSEEQKINTLIEFVSSLNSAQFIRNGEEYSPKEAAQHLQMKRKKAGNNIQSALSFIDNIATKSSVTGQLYLIRFANGKTITCKQVLLNELKKIESK